MGMFDWYRPVPAVVSPETEAELTGWQGKDGPCALLLWEQGKAAPVDQLVDDEVKLARERLDRFSLPERFEIYTTEGDRWWVAEGRAARGVWAETVLRPDVKRRASG